MTTAAKPPGEDASDLAHPSGVERGTMSVRMLGVATVVGWLLVVYALRRLPVPGLDHEALAAWSRSGPGATISFSVLPFGWVALVVARAGRLLAIGRAPAWAAPISRVAFVAYLGLTLLQIVPTLTVLEEMSWNLPIVLHPGWESRLTMGVTWLAASSVLWLAADRISSTRLAHGTLLLVLLDGLGWLGGALVGAGEEVGRVLVGGGVPGAELTPVLLVLPVLLGLLAVAARRPRWPVEVLRGLWVYSTVDVLGLAGLAALLGSLPIAGLSELLPRAEPALRALFGALIVGIGLWRWRPAGDGSPPWGARIGAAAVLVWVVAAVWLGLTKELRLEAVAAHPALTRPSLEVVLASDGHGAADLPILVERLKRAGVVARTAEATETRVVLHLYGDTTGFDPDDLVRRRAFGVHAVTPRGALPQVPPGLVPAPDRGRTDPWASTDPAAASRLRGEAMEHGRTVAVECTEPAACDLWVLEPAALDASHVAEARVEHDPYLWEPVVRVQLTPEGTERLARFSGEMVGEVIVVAVEGRVLIAPVVQEVIGGGQLVISSGGDAFARELLLALTGSTAGAWVVDSVRVPDQAP